MAWRVANNEAVNALISDWTTKQKTTAASDALIAAGVVASPVQTIDDLLKWPHLEARRMIDPVIHPLLGQLDGLKAAGFPVKFSDCATGYKTGAALTGTHTRDVLTDLLDLDDAELDDLANRNII